MTQEEKELLLKDLCARLPYYTCVLVDYIDEYNVNEVLNAHHIIGLKYYTGDDGLINIKPYLRPMSSMTEEERVEYRKAVDKDFAILEDSIDAPIAYEYSDRTIVRDKPLFNEIDWLNKKMFDYRGLISMGIALEAPDGMYNIKHNN